MKFEMLTMKGWLKWIYLLFLIKNGLAGDSVWRKAVVHQDRILNDNHYRSLGGALTKIEKIPFPEGLVESVSSIQCLNNILNQLHY